MKKDFVVSAYIVNKGKVLLVHHIKLKAWLPIGGHIEEGEIPEVALNREAMEEAGIEIEIIGKRDQHGGDDRVRILKTPHHIQLEEIDGVHQHIDLIFFARTKNQNVKLKTDEHHDIKWFGENDLDSEDITANVIYYAKLALKEII